MMCPLVPHMWVVLSERVHKTALLFELIVASAYVNILPVFITLIELQYVITPASVYCQCEPGAC